MKSRLIKQFMTPEPIMLDPESTIEHAAAKMEAIDSGIFPVGDKDHVQGIITDRDIVVRALAKGLSPKTTKVKEIMTKTTQSILQDATIAEAAAQMRRYHVSRLLVKNLKGSVTGILSLGHLVRNSSPEVLEEVLERTHGKAKAA